MPARDTAGISHPQKADLLDHLNTWEEALRKANATFKAVPSDDLPVSRAVNEKQTIRTCAGRVTKLRSRQVKYTT